MITKDDLQRAQSRKYALRFIAMLTCRRMLREFCRLDHLPNGLNDMPA
jgi:hypothetical protein